MSEEYLDLVDENGELTGERELRSVCHAKGLWHRSVHIYLFRKINGTIELLTHLRSLTKDTSPGKWTMMFGGHIESGQTLQETISTELSEEIGLVVDFNELITGLTLLHDRNKNREFVYSYFLRFNDDAKKLVFNDDEVQQVKWMTFDEIKKSVKANPDKWSNITRIINLIKKDLLYRLSQKI